MLVKINRHISSGPSTHHNPGEIKDTSQMPGCDVNWLVTCGAITPLGSRVGPLLSDDPSKEELLAEVGRMQTKIEDQEDELDSLRRELDRAVKEVLDLRTKLDRHTTPADALTGILPPSSAEPPEPESERIKAELASLKSTVDRLTAERDAARDRADKYAGELSGLSPVAPTTPPELTPAAPESPATPADLGRVKVAPSAARSKK